MNKIYDKLLLLIAFLALLGGIAVYVMKSGSAPSGPAVASQPADNAYQAVPVPESAVTDASWPEPGEQSTGWVFDVFTPPKIYIDENGRFSAEGWVPVEELPFGVYLVDIVQKLYRIQIQGYIEEDRSDASKSLLLLFDEENQTRIRVRPGDVVEEAEFEILDFEIVRNIDPETSTVEKVATATLLDKRTGEELKLVHGEELYEKAVTVTIAADEDPSNPIQLSEEGVSFETTAGQYVLKQINLEEKTVTVEKQAAEDDDEPETRTLSPQTAPEAVIETPDSPAQSVPGGFDFSF